MSTDERKNQSVGEWSATVNGLRGRLLLSFEDLNPGLRHAIYLELRNDGFAPVVVSNLPTFRAALSDSSGNPVSTSGVVSDGPMPILQWAVVPRDAYLGLRVDMQTAGVPTREHKRVFLGIGGKAWELGAGKYRLEATAVFTPEATGPTNQWTGELELPAVEIVVTDEMFN